MNCRAISCHALTFLKKFAVFICLILTACASPSSPEKPTPVATCISPNPAANPYAYFPKTYVSIIYQLYKTKPNLARQVAFSQLADYVRRSSDYGDMSLSDTQSVRITVTYISPQLVEYIILNDILFEQDSSENLDNEIKAKLSDLGSRNELFFFITLTGPSYNGQAYGNNLLTVSIPFNQMRLINGSDVTASPTHDDHVLNEPILITHGPVSGIIAFPISVINGNHCEWVVDPKWNTTITLDIPSAALNQTEYGTQSWSIPYSPLVEPGTQITVPSFIPTPGFDTGRVSPLTMPPTMIWPSTKNTQDAKWQAYWEDMARYIWNQIVRNEQP